MKERQSKNRSYNLFRKNPMPGSSTLKTSIRAVYPTFITQTEMIAKEAIEVLLEKMNHGRTGKCSVRWSL